MKRAVAFTRVQTREGRVLVGRLLVELGEQHRDELEQAAGMRLT